VTAIGSPCEPQADLRARPAEFAGNLRVANPIRHPGACCREHSDSAIGARDLVDRLRTVAAILLTNLAEPVPTAGVPKAPARRSADGSPV